MGFQINRLHKWEENLENQITIDVEQCVLEFYGVDDVFELTEEQIKELDEYRTLQLSEYSPLQIGFSNLINWWESEQ